MATSAVFLGESSASQIASSSSSFGYMTSKEMLLNYIKQLPKQEIRKLLTPVRDGLLTENTVLHMNMQNISIDYVVVPLTISEFLTEIGGNWAKWIHSSPSVDPHEVEDPAHNSSLYRHAPYGINSLRDKEYSQRIVHDYINDMGKYEKRALLNLVREGILTDECFINLTSHTGPERIQVPMSRVVDVMKNDENLSLQFHTKKPRLLRIVFMKHYSSANFSMEHKADLIVRALSVARYSMPIWYTILFLLSTLGTFVSHIWSQATNYAGLQSSLQFTLPTIVLIVSSLLIAALLYMTIYMVGFLCCAEQNYHADGLLTKDLDYLWFYRHFCELSQIQRRIYIMKGLYFVLLWYTLLLTIFAHEKDLNIYPALICTLTNGFGFILFTRIAEFFLKFRRTRNGTAIAAR